MKKVNLTSTEEISNSQLSKIMEEVAIDAKKKAIQVHKKLFNEIEQGIKLAHEKHIRTK